MDYLNDGELAQLVERLRGTQKAIGSNPIFSTNMNYLLYIKCRHVRLSHLKKIEKFISRI